MYGITASTFRRLKAASLRGGLVLGLFQEQVERALHYGLVERVGQDLYITAAGRTAWEDREARGLYDLAHVVRDD